VSATSAEVEKWRMQEVGKLRGEKDMLLAQRAELRRPFYAKSAGTPFPP
jgi:hypothetical protein